MNQMDYSDNSQNNIELPKKRRFPKIFWISLIIFLFILGYLMTQAYNFGSKVFVSKGSFLKKTFNLIFHGSPNALSGEGDDRINILLLGYGGEGHEGPYLTDTIILASINPDTKDILLTSIPRDYYYPTSLGNKVNTAFADGLEKSKYDFNSGGEAAIKSVEKITGLDVAYFAALDFKGFEEAIDEVGGVEVNVERTFTDTTFPNDRFGYLPPLTFTKGLQTMSGKRALQYARSRHAEGNEGSDFARSKRQQLIIEAFKNKLQNLDLISDSKKLKNLLEILANHFYTNLEPAEIVHLGKMLNSDQTKVQTATLNLDLGVICQTILEDTGEYIIRPCQGVSEKEVKKYFEDSFNYLRVRNENPSIILESAGTDPNLYDATKRKFIAVGLEFYETPYRGLPIRQSVVYEVNSKAETKKFLEDILNVKVQPKPAELKATADYVVIVGGKGK